LQINDPAPLKKSTRNTVRKLKQTAGNAKKVENKAGSYGTINNTI